MTPALRLALLGGDVAASPSATMQQAALDALGLAGSYRNIDTDAAGIGAVMRSLRDGELDGCNVTMPLKAIVAAACDELRGDAAVLGVVNTVVVAGSRLLGFNTDAAGFGAALRELRLTPAAEASAVVLGAGGAAAAVTLALLRVPCRVTVAARRQDAAAQVAARLHNAGRVATCAWDHDALAPLLGSAAIVVNATPAGVEAMPFDVRRLPPSCTVADVRNRPQPVDLAAAAAAAGLAACDGTEMLVQQGVRSFELWTGRVAPTGVMRRALYEALHA